MSQEASVKDSGKRQAFDTGSVRDTQEGKGRYDLLPPRVLEAYAQHMAAGCQKYGERNWEKGQPISRFFASAMRHLQKYWAGAVDEMHLQAAFWNIACIIEMEGRVLNETLPEAIDDHPCKTTAPLILRSP